MVKPPYIPVMKGKWWYRTLSQLMGMKLDQRRSFELIGRIMETELGEKKQAGARCQFCRENDLEWVFTADGVEQIANSGERCARCRVKSRKGGCSLTTTTLPGFRKAPQRPLLSQSH